MDTPTWLAVMAGGTVAILLPAGLLYTAFDARRRGFTKSAARIATAALWSGAVVYSGFGFAALVHAKNAPPGASVGVLLHSIPFGILAILACSGGTVLGAWWLLRNAEAHADETSLAELMAEEKDAQSRRASARSGDASTPPAGVGQGMP